MPRSVTLRSVVRRSNEMLRSVRPRPPVPCPTCGARRGQVHFRYPVGRLGAKRRAGIDWGAIPMQGCRSCGFSWATEPPPNLGEYYASAYSATTGRDRRPPPAEYFADEAAMLKPERARHHVALATKFLGREVGTAMDVGAGLGNFLWMIPAERKLAVEPDEAMAPYLRHAGAARVDLDEVPAGTVDVAVSSHHLEHIPIDDVPEVLDGVRRALGDDGVLVIEVPGACLLRYDLSHKRHAPHLLFFSIEALDRLLERSGFEVLHLEAGDKRYQVLPTPRYEPSTAKTEYQLGGGPLRAVARPRS